MAAGHSRSEPSRQTEARPNLLDGDVGGHAVQVGSVQGDMYLHHVSGASVVPRQLPAANPRFAGRETELERLTNLFDGRTDATGDVAIIAIDGLAGVGKTTLAVNWAHRMAVNFPDGQLYVDMRGFDPELPPVAPANALGDFLQALGVAAADQPTGEAGAESLYRSLLSTRRVLVVIDNALSEDQVRPVLPGTSTCLVLVTSRRELAGLVSANGARVFKLDVLGPLEAEGLLSAHIGPQRVSSDKASTRRLIEACGGLPLALAIVAARAALRPAFPLSLLAAELADESARLDILDTGQIQHGVRAAFSWSYSSLTSAAGQLLCRLGAHTGPDVDKAAAASLVGQPVGAVIPVLYELTTANLVEEHAPGRFTLHNLVRRYAVELAQEAEDEHASAQVALGILDHYLRISVAADRVLDPAREAIVLEPPPSGVSTPTMTDNEAALAWFDEEHGNLVFAVSHAHSYGLNVHVWQLAWALSTYFYWRAKWHDLATVQGLALDSARQIGDERAQAEALRGLGRALTRLGEYDRAQECHLEALEMCTALDDKVGQAVTHHALSFMYDRQGRREVALEHAERAYPLWYGTGNLAREARALNDLGWAHARVGDYHVAIDECQRALADFPCRTRTARLLRCRTSPG